MTKLGPSNHGQEGSINFSDQVAYNSWGTTNLYKGEPIRTGKAEPYKQQTENKRLSAIQPKKVKGESIYDKRPYVCIVIVNFS